MSPVGVILGKRETYRSPELIELRKRDLVLIARDLGSPLFPIHPWTGQVWATKERIVREIKERLS